MVKAESSKLKAEGKKAISYNLNAVRDNSEWGQCAHPVCGRGALYPERDGRELSEPRRIDPQVFSDDLPVTEALRPKTEARRPDAF